MNFLVDRCAGRRLAAWLRDEGHDVAELPEGPDPGDRGLLEQAVREKRILITLDTDFGHLVFVGGMVHCGLVRLPDVPAESRIELMRQVLERHGDALTSASVITVRGGRIRISQPGP